MNFSETFNEFSLLTEGPGGQRTYKDFLLFLAKFLGIKMPTNYKTNWVLHHRDCNHFNNSEFENLVLMNPVHHISLHVQLHTNENKDVWDFLEVGTTKNGDKFEYWLIGEDIAARIDRVQTEPEISHFASQV
jgi:hypothetical protein